MPGARPVSVVVPRNGLGESPGARQRDLCRRGGGKPVHRDGEGTSRDAVLHRGQRFAVRDDRQILGKRCGSPGVAVRADVRGTQRVAARHEVLEQLGGGEGSGEATRACDLDLGRPAGGEAGHHDCQRSLRRGRFEPGWIAVTAPARGESQAKQNARPGSPLEGRTEDGPKHQIACRFNWLGLRDGKAFAPVPAPSTGGISTRGAKRGSRFRVLGAVLGARVLVPGAECWVLRAGC